MKYDKIAREPAGPRRSFAHKIDIREIMNWLAHVYLSNPQVEHRLGNLLTDTLRPHELEGYGDLFTAGVKCHYEIDRFTDSHELVKQSKARLFKKYLGILDQTFAL